MPHQLGEVLDGLKDHGQLGVQGPHQLGEVQESRSQLGVQDFHQRGEVLDGLKHHSQLGVEGPHQLGEGQEGRGQLGAGFELSPVEIVNVAFEFYSATSCRRASCPSTSCLI